MFCEQCGKEIAEGKSFCENCGAPAGTSAPPAANIPLPAPRKKSRKRLIVGLAIGGACVLVAAIVLVLVFVVFKTPGPESTVQVFFKTFKTKNENAMMKTIDAEYFKGQPEVEKAFRKESFMGLPQGADFKDLAFKTEVNGDKATVNIVKGIAVFKENGQQKTFDIAKDKDTKFFMVKRNGKWYITPDSFGTVLADAYVAVAGPAKEMLLNELDAMDTSNQTVHDYISSTATTTTQHLKELIAANEAKFHEYKDATQKTEAVFKKMAALKGEGIDDYTEYAKLSLDYFDTVVQDFTLDIEGDKIIADKWAAADANQPVDAYDAKIDEVDKKLDEFYQKEDDLDNKIKALEDKLPSSSPNEPGLST